MRTGGLAVERDAVTVAPDVGRGTVEGRCVATLGAVGECVGNTLLLVAALGLGLVLLLAALPKIFAAALPGAGSWVRALVGSARPSFDSATATVADCVEGSADGTRLALRSDAGRTEDSRATNSAASFATSMARSSSPASIK
jgi:hypothetical protein